MGMGAPQARWREISQSRNRYETAVRPFPSRSSHSITAWMLSGDRTPLNGPELTMIPS